MKISVVIPAFNEEKLLPSTLAAVQKAFPSFESLGWSTEIIVCDNNSKDDTANIARNLGAHVVFESINQIGRARNTGAAAASGDWLIFLDADSLPSPALFDAVAHHIRSGRVLAGGAALRLDESRWWFHLITEFWVLWSRISRQMAGSFIFVESATFRETGGFSGKLYAGEELEFSQRIKSLARQRNLRVTIINHPRLVTSARKARLYSGREMIGFFTRALFRPRKTLSDRDACHIWYDGRR